VADFNVDGGADLAVPNFYSNTLSVLLNLPMVSLFPNKINFGKEKVGNTTSPRIVTVGNPSGTPITFKSLKITGADAGDFAQTNNCPVSPTTLSSGNACTVTLDLHSEGERAA
jgi:hypothetical protein